MNKDSRKKRIEEILTKNFSPKMLFVRDDSKEHEGRAQISQNSRETHFFIKMVINDYNNLTKVKLHRKVYTLLDNEFSSGLHALELDLKNS